MVQVLSAEAHVLVFLSFKNLSMDYLLDKKITVKNGTYFPVVHKLRLNSPCKLMAIVVQLVVMHSFFVTALNNKGLATKS